ncbi:MAG: DUF6273 domain-containing protein [Ruminococcus sp.]|nr:DUF6273 domain-containing protein [Ruminococcus sp.]
MKRNDIIEFGKKEWIVLDVKKSKALIMSKNILFYERYNKDYTYTTWARSSLREYLNTKFIKRFSKNDRSFILYTENENLKNPIYGERKADGAVTNDRLFLLSLDEISKYFCGIRSFKRLYRIASDTEQVYSRLPEASRKRLMPKASELGNTTEVGITPDLFEAFRMKNIIEFNKPVICDPHFIPAKDGAGTKHWYWLRSPGFVSSNVCAVHRDGVVDFYGDFCDIKEGGVRPAMWVAVKN